MSNPRDWSTGAKLLTISLVCLVLAIGLCGTGAGFESGTPAQNFRTGAGVFALAAAGLFLVIGLMVMGIAAIHRDDK